MTQRTPGLFSRALRGTWNGLNFARRLLLNLIFLALVAVVLVALFSPGPRLDARTTLLVEPVGDIVEQFTVEPLARAVARAQGEAIPEVRLRDLLEALDGAADDPRIERVALRTDGIGYVGFAALRELASALGRVRAAGKQVVAYADSMDQKQYYLAAHADEVYLHPEGLVWLEGLSNYRSYYREALQDKLGLQVHLFRVGEFKSFGEPFILDAPSEAAIAADRFWMDDIWQRWLDDVAAARGIDAGELQARIARSDEELAANAGDTARLAEAWGLIDGILSEDEVYDLLLERGAANAEGDLVATGVDEFLDLRARERSPIDQRPQVAVVVAQGEILDGEQPPGTVGGPSTAALIREAREDDEVKALVLRVDSPGGSVFASEQIRREVELTREAGKPVIASMANVAASGGYWISMNADQIFADPSTLTGSIGIFGLLFTAPDTLAKIGVRVGGSGTTPLAGALDLRKPLEPMLGRMIQSLIDKGYRDFIGKVAQARERDEGDIDQVARGRVWSGQQALDRGLVDALGGLKDSIAAAASRAGLAEGSYRVRYVETEPSALERFVDSMSRDATARRAVAHLAPLAGPLPLLPLDPASRAQLARELPWLTPPPAGSRPMRSLAHCFCRL